MEKWTFIKLFRSLHGFELIVHLLKKGYLQRLSKHNCFILNQKYGRIKLVQISWDGMNFPRSALCIHISP